MSASQQPFTDLVTKKQSEPTASGWGWPVAIVLAGLMAAESYVWYSSHAKQGEELESLRARLAAAETNLSAAVAENQAGKDLIGQLTAQVADLQKEKQETVQKASGLENQLRSDLESKDVTISKLQGKLTVSILDRVLFDSGEAQLKPEGAAVIKKIGLLLAQHPEIKIQVVGHTDNVPIRPTAHGRFASNWELSTARALAAVHFLTEEAGVDPRRVGAVGYGEYRPVADNSTPEGRAKNRRIAITIMSDELAGVDARPPSAPAPAPAPKPEPDTNSLPVISSAGP